MYKYVVVIIAIVVFAGCQNIEYPKKPKNLIPEDKMVEVMIDIQLFNTAKTYNRLPMQQAGLTPYEYIYERHEIDSLQFLESNTYYGANLDKYGNLYTKVKTYLEIEKSKLDTIFAVEKRKQDSIKIITDSLKLLRINLPNSGSVNVEAVRDSISE